MASAVAVYGDVSVVVAGVGVDCYGAHVCCFVGSEEVLLCEGEGVLSCVYIR